MWYFGAGLGGVRRLMYVQQRNQTRALVCAKGEWSRNDLWIFYCNGLEEVQDVVAIFCDGGQRLGGGLLCLTFLCCLLVLYLHVAFAVFVVVVVFLPGGFPFLRPLCDGVSKNLQDLSRVQLPVDDYRLREE